MKFRWFRQRLDVEEASNYEVAEIASNGREESDGLSRGVYRQALGDDFEDVVLRKHQNLTTNQRRKSISECTILTIWKGKF
jgi:hypothetical protein